MTDEQLSFSFQKFNEDNPIMSEDELFTVQKAMVEYVQKVMPWANEVSGGGYSQISDELKLKYYEAYMSGGRIMRESVFDAMDQLKLYLDTLVSEEIIQPGIQEDILNIFKNKFLRRIGNETVESV